MLLERGLGIGVDPVRQVDDLVAGRLDGGGDPGLVVLVRGGGARGGQLGHAGLLTGRDCPGSRQPSAERGPMRDQRSAERVASATTTRAMMKIAIGSSSRPWSRRMTRTATTIPTQAARRIARSQSPR